MIALSDRRLPQEQADSQPVAASKHSPPEAIFVGIFRSTGLCVCRRTSQRYRVVKLNEVAVVMPMTTHHLKWDHFCQTTEFQIS